MFRWKYIQYGVEQKLGNCICIVNLAPYLGKPAFLILGNENMRVPWPGDCAGNSKLKNVGFWLSPHFADFLYINSRYTAMAAYYVTSPVRNRLTYPFRMTYSRIASTRSPWKIASPKNNKWPKSGWPRKSNYPQDGPQN